MSGTAMCMNTISVKKRLSSVSGEKKFRAIGSPKIGSLSSHSVLTSATYCASVSHTIQ